MPTQGPVRSEDASASVHESLSARLWTHRLGHHLQPSFLGAPPPYPLGGKWQEPLGQRAVLRCTNLANPTQTGGGDIPKSQTAQSKPPSSASRQRCSLTLEAPHVVPRLLPAARRKLKEHQNHPPHRFVPGCSVRRLRVQKAAAAGPPLRPAPSSDGSTGQQQPAPA
jgi:hypothetical protein